MAHEVWLVLIQREGNAGQYVLMGRLAMVRTAHVVHVDLHVKVEQLLGMGAT